MARAGKLGNVYARRGCYEIARALPKEILNIGKLRGSCPRGPAPKGLESLAQGLPWVSRNSRLALKGLEMRTKHVNVNLLRYFSEPATLNDEAKTFLQRGMTLAMEWAVQGLVVPHVGRTIDSTVEAINAGLRSLKAGTGALGKIAVIVDRDLVEGN
jgi:hypothetical protein